MEKQIHAASVFSALKINPELSSLSSQPPTWFAKQENKLGTITHGLLLQRKALAEGLNAIIKKFPDTSVALQDLVAENSQVKNLSDQILQYVCAHRAETIEMRRKAFKPKNEVLNGVLHSIPPSTSHLFDEKQMIVFMKDNGGPQQIFASARPKDRRDRNYFRRPMSAPSTKNKQSTWRTRATATHQPPTTKSSKFNQRKRASHNFNKDDKAKKTRRY